MTTAKNKSSVKPDKTLDLIGFYCPIPVYRTREETDKMKVGQVLEILADDPAAEEDISRWAKRTGQEMILFEKSDEGKLRFLIRKKK